MSRIFKTHSRYWSEIAVYGDYLPWNVHKSNGGDRSNYPEHSGRILDLKGGSAIAVDHFRGQIEPELIDKIAVVTVPSHDPAKPGIGLSQLAAALTKNGNRVDASSCLVRTRKTDKRAHGGDRSEKIHLESITVKNAQLIKGRDVLLLDDVSKTGNSLRACRNLLLAAGARSVECAAIGKT